MSLDRPGCEDWPDVKPDPLCEQRDCGRRAIGEYRIVIRTDDRLPMVLALCGPCYEAVCDNPQTVSVVDVNDESPAIRESREA